MLLLLAWTVLRHDLGWAWREVLVLLLAAPCAAGALVAAAVGDRWRGALSVAALMLFLPADLGGWRVVAALGLDASNAMSTVAELALVCALAAAGAVPPLVHLGWQRRTGVPSLVAGARA